MFKGYIRKSIQKINKIGIRFLTTPRKIFSPSEVTDINALAMRIKPADVILISGNARISSIVKLLTNSVWSHVVLYIGPREDLLSNQEKEDIIIKYGEEALAHLCVDADPILGVHLKPLQSYFGLMLRQCRAKALTKSDITKVINHSCDQIGKEYDMIHIFKLLLFFGFPWGVLPIRVRKFFTDFTISETDTICSRVIAESFHSVGYPIRPNYLIKCFGAENNQFRKNIKSIYSLLTNRRKSALTLAKGGKLKMAYQRMSNDRYMKLELKKTRHITPSDYDLSRFFEIIKDPEDLNIEYRSSITKIESN